jgi:catechol 2,3-dioxygenase-like lactoylglutathione lyase family enzyme
MTHLATPQPARHPLPTVKAAALAYLRFARPDLDEAERFLTDFGLRIAERRRDALFFRATGPQPFCYAVQRAPVARFVGLALELGARADLDTLRAAVPGASAPESLDAPGGGERVRLVDPSGFIIEAVHGRMPVTPLPYRAPLALNTATEHPRVNAAQRPEAAPADVMKLGHVVLEAADFQATCAWYTRHFGFIPSDVQVLPDGSPAVVFMRLDLGDVPADHHTLALVQGIVPLYSHSAYEVPDLDAVGIGQRVLRERGWKHAWGIGRHILGSQIFDYWQDPWGDKHEHYTDGDLFDAARPMGVHAFHRGAMAQWGPAMPRSFARPKLSRALVREALRNLHRSPDLSIGKLLAMARLLA